MDEKAALQRMRLRAGLKLGLTPEQIDGPLLMDMLNIIDDGAQAQLDELYNWFVSVHADDWLGTIPADIRGVIGHYLCVRRYFSYSREVQISMFGRLQSYLDHPAVTNSRDGLVILVWRHRDQLHRDNKPAIVRIESMNLYCNWYTHGIPYMNSLGINDLKIYDGGNSYSVRTADKRHKMEQVQEDIAELSRELWATYMG